MSDAAAEAEPGCGVAQGPHCSQCQVPMRLQRSEPPYIDTGRTVRVFRCQSCGLLEVVRLPTEPL